MTKTQYKAAIKALGLSPHSKATARALGRSLRQIAAYASGESPVPEPIAKLLRLMVEKKLNPEEV